MMFVKTFYRKNIFFLFKLTTTFIYTGIYYNFDTTAHKANFILNDTNNTAFVYSNVLNHIYMFYYWIELINKTNVTKSYP